MFVSKQTVELLLSLCTLKCENIIWMKILNIMLTNHYLISMEIDKNTLCACVCVCVCVPERGRKRRTYICENSDWNCLCRCLYFILFYHVGFVSLLISRLSIEWINDSSPKKKKKCSIRKQFCPSRCCLPTFRIDICSELLLIRSFIYSQRFLCSIWEKMTCSNIEKKSQRCVLSDFYI